MRRLDRVDTTLFEGLAEEALQEVYWRLRPRHFGADEAALADVPITPRFGPGTWRYFHLADRYLAAGEQAAEAALPRLAALARPHAR